MRKIVSVGLAFLLCAAEVVFARADAPPPAPFLAIPFAQKDGIHEVSQGWVYSKDEADIHPQYPTHFAVDFPAKWGTPVYAPADGLAVGSYHTADILDSKGRTIGYGLGLFIQIWHPQAGVYTSYCHLSRINDKVIPYVAPVFDGKNWQPKQALYVPNAEFVRQAKPVKKGDLIGYVGYTGLRRGYDEGNKKAYDEEASNPPKVDPKVNFTWDPHGAHLHWEVYTRSADGAKKALRYDPFGLMAEREAYSTVFTKASGLILANPDGSPQFAR